MFTLNELLNYWQQIPIRHEIIYSILWVMFAIFTRLTIVRWHFKHEHHLSIDDKRRWLVGSRNITIVICLLGLIAVWAVQIQTFALSMVALAAATVVATKELIMCLSGSLLRFSTRQYSVGDYIKINGIRGRVIDINLFNTLMMQVGPHDLIGQLSGRTLSFPNSLLLTHSVERDNILGHQHYVVHTIDIPVPIHLDSDAIIPVLEKIVHQTCQPFFQEIQDYFDQVQAQKFFITPAALPRISRVPFDDKTYHIIVRFASPAEKRLEIQQSILDEFIRLQYRLLKNP